MEHQITVEIELNESTVNILQGIAKINGLTVEEIIQIAIESRYGAEA